MFRSGWLVETVPEANTGACYVGILNDNYYVGYEITGYDRTEDVMDIHAYAQDTWNISDRLTLNIGVRFEYNSLWWPAQGSAEPITYNEAGWDLSIVRQIEERTKVYSWTNLAPRLGIIYDISGDGKTLAVATTGSSGWLLDTGFQSSGPAPVGGSTMPINKLKIMTPYIAFAAAIAIILLITKVGQKIVPILLKIQKEMVK